VAFPIPKIHSQHSSTFKSPDPRHSPLRLALTPTRLLFFLPFFLAHEYSIGSLGIAARRLPRIKCDHVVRKAMDEPVLARGDLDGCLGAARGAERGS
jgi:hypothetical protein